MLRRSELESVGKTILTEKDLKKITTETLVLLLTYGGLHRLEKDSRTELAELKARQKKVSILHDLTKSLNKITTPDGKLDYTNNPEILAKLQAAKEMGVDFDESVTKYDNESRNRLIDNIRMTVDDLNVQNEMQIQTVTRLTNERYEFYQMARSITKPLHDDKLGKARAMSGR